MTVRTLPPDRLAPRAAVGLAVIIGCRLILLLDATIVNVALPSIQRGLGLSTTSLSWVVSAYALAFGGLLLVGGRLGDIVGRRRMFGVGVAVFTAASFLGGLATSGWWLIACRAAQGVGAALAAPSTMALVVGSFTAGPARTRALAIYGATGVLGSALGLVLGGALAQWDWRLVMFVNVPIGLAVLLLTPRFVTRPAPVPGRVDVVGGVLSTAAMVSLVLGFVQVAGSGWSSAATLAALLAGLVLLGVFVATQRRAVRPIVPLRLFADRDRAISYSVLFLSAGAMGAVYFFLTQFVQNVLHYGPLRAGVAFLPMAAVMLPGSSVIPRLLARLGPRPLTIAGAAGVTAAAAWLSRVGPQTGYLTGLLGPMVVFGAGLALLTLPLTVTGMHGVDAEDTGAASSLFNAVLQLGGSVGLSALLTVYATGASHAPGGDATTRLTHGVTAALAGAAVLGLVCLALTSLLRRRDHA